VMCRFPPDRCRENKLWCWPIVRRREKVIR
jgi:hypothetical protein